MKRKVHEGGEDLNARLTDLMIENANATINVWGSEVAERYVSVHRDVFYIEVETGSDYQSFKFRLDSNNNPQACGHEGDFKY